MDEKALEQIKQLLMKDQLDILWDMVFGMQKVIDAYGLIWALWEKKMHEFQTESVQEIQSISIHRRQESAVRRR